MKDNFTIVIVDKSESQAYEIKDSLVNTISSTEATNVNVKVATNPIQAFTTFINIPARMNLLIACVERPEPNSTDRLQPMGENLIAQLGSISLQNLPIIVYSSDTDCDYVTNIFQKLSAIDIEATYCGNMAPTEEALVFSNMLLLNCNEENFYQKLTHFASQLLPE